jgi:hypothetical protein
MGGGGGGLSQIRRQPKKSWVSKARNNDDNFAWHGPFLVSQSVRFLPALCPDSLQFPGLQTTIQIQLFVHFFIYDGTAASWG